MPTYIYKCSDCKHIFEELHPMSEADKDQICPECKAMAKRHYAHTTSHFIFSDGNNFNVINKSPMRNANKGLRDDL